MSSEISRLEENFLIYEKVDEVRQGKLTRRSFAKMLTTFGLTAIGVGAVIAAADIPVTPVTQKVEHADGREEHNIRLHDRHLQHQASGNTENLTNDYAHHAIVEDSMHAEPLVGRAAIMEHKVRVWLQSLEQLFTLKIVLHGANRWSLSGLRLAFIQENYII